MKEPWFFLTRALFNQGDQAPVYPCQQLKQIESLETTRSALLDETGPIEVEFGIDAASPIYRLVWQLNKFGGIATSHTAVGMTIHGCLPGYEWADHALGLGLTIISRDRSHHHNQSKAFEMAEQISAILTFQKAAAPNTSGWRVEVIPAVIQFNYLKPGSETEIFYQPGYGCELIISSFAGTRQRAGNLLKAVCSFLADTIAKVQISDASSVGLPHVHPK